MAPKGKGKKAGKAAPPLPVDTVSTEDMSKDQLEEHIVLLRKELEREREERSFFQLERDQLQAFWEMSRRNLEQRTDDLRHRQREREEAEQRHRVEINVYKQKLRHFLSEQHDAVFEMKMEASASQNQKRHTEAELLQRAELHGLQADLREKTLQEESCIKELKLKQQVELMELTNTYDHRIREIEVKYHKKMELMREEEGKKQRAEIKELEERMNARIATLMEEHERTVRGAEEYYSAVQTKVLYDQKVLKEEAAEVQKQLSRAEKQLAAAQEENKRLHQSLQEAEQKLPELQQQLQDYHHARAHIVKDRARAKLMEKELRDLKVEHELLLQAFEKVQQERDELLRMQTEAIFDLQRRSDMKELELERKLAAMTLTLEKKEAQLCAALSATDRTTGSSSAGKLEEILEAKRSAIGSLQEDLVQECKEYDHLLRGCRERLNSLGVSRYDFPFRPAQQILNGLNPKP